MCEKMKYIGIVGIVLAIIGVIYNVNCYMDHNTERKALIAANTSKIPEVYNSNIIKINDLAGQANQHVIYGICFCVFGGVSSIIKKAKK